MSGFAVVPESLVPPAEACQRAAEVLSEVARAVLGVTVPTGRPDSELACALVVQAVGPSLRSLVLAVDGEAEALRAARARYGAAEHVAGGG